MRTRIHMYARIQENTPVSPQSSEVKSEGVRTYVIQQFMLTLVRIYTHLTRLSTSIKSSSMYTRMCLSTRTVRLRIHDMCVCACTRHISGNAQFTYSEINMHISTHIAKINCMPLMSCTGRSREKVLLPSFIHRQIHIMYSYKYNSRTHTYTCKTLKAPEFCTGPYIRIYT